MNKLLHTTSYLILTLALVSMLTFLYWGFYPYNILKYNGDKSPVLNENKTVQAGDMIRIRTDVDQFTSGYIVQVNPQIIDGVIINYPSFDYTTKVGHQVFERVFEVPNYLPSGVYHLELQSVIRLNPIRTMTIVTYSEDFTITGCKIITCK